MRASVGLPWSCLVLASLACVTREPSVDEPPQLEPAANQPSVDEQEQPATQPHWLDELDAIGHIDAPDEPAEQAEPAERPKPPPRADPGPPTPRYAAIPAGHLRLEPVSQAPVPLDEGLWLSDGDRPVLFAEDLDGCALFDLPTGRVLSRSAPGVETVCDLWLTDDHPPPPDGRSISWPDSGSHDGELLVENDDAALHISGGGRPDQVLDCGGCSYAMQAFAPEDHRLAALSFEPLRVDIWDADTGKRVERFSLSAPGEINTAKLAWNERGVVALVEHIDLDDGDDDYDYGYAEPDVSAWFWPGKGAMKRRLRLFPGEDLQQLDLDPQLRWVFVYRSTTARDTETRRLSTVALTDQNSGLDWTWTERYDDYDDDSLLELDRRWRGGATTQLLETRIDEVEKGSKVTLTMSWRALVAEPDAGVDGRVVYRAKGLPADDVLPMLKLYGIAGKTSLIEWAVDEFADRIRGSVLELGNCEGIDASPRLRYMLATCGRGSLALLDLEVLDDARGGKLMVLDGDAKTDHLWGRSDWLAVRGTSNELVLVDLQTATVRLERDDVEALTELALGTKFDRLAIVTANGVELLDAMTGKTLLSLPRFTGRAGLDPDGKRLAYIDGGQVHVVEVASGKLLASWAEPEWVDVAWRQDGAALLLGAGVPKLVVDASDGKPLASLTHDEWRRLKPEDFDPSWRWAYLEDDRVVRTLDGMGLRFGPGWVRLDCGLVEGSLHARSPELRDYAYRAGDDPFVVPRISAATAHPWIVRKGVTAAFFAGEAIAPPSIPEAKAR